MYNNNSIASVLVYTQSYHRFESKGLVEYEPDPDHFNEDGSIAEGVPQRGQPWVDLGVSRYVFG